MRLADCLFTLIGKQEKSWKPAARSLFFEEYGSLMTFCMCSYFMFWTCFLIAAKVSLLMSCSIL
ncbi:MAG: hypothetical protein RRY35_08240, partial [Clostridiales bacterium]